MSKIYEALLRAERDRAESGSDSVASGTSREASTSVIVEEPAQTAWDTVSPQPATAGGLDYASEGTLVSAAADSRFPGARQQSVLSDVPRVTSPSSGVKGASNPVKLGDIAIDLSKVRPRTWTPAFAQLPALQERGSAVEQFRSLRSRMFEFRDLNKLKSLMVSSGLPQEGKSFITANLAVSFAMHKASRVLLIDGDMRRSSLHKMLGAPNDVGLSDYLGGKVTLLEAMQRADTGDLPLPPGLASLTFIAGGTEAEKAADLSGNRRFDHLIATLSPFFDWIVVDSSPVNLVADGVNLARACDGVLLIARGGTTKYETAQRALSELKASRILGFVLNAVKKPPVTGGYYGYDSYDSYDPEPSEPEPSTK